MESLPLLPKDKRSFFSQRWRVHCTAASWLCVCPPEVGRLTDICKPSIDAGWVLISLLSNRETHCCNRNSTQQIVTTYVLHCRVLAFTVTQMVYCVQESPKWYTVYKNLFISTSNQILKAAFLLIRKQSTWQVPNDGTTYLMWVSARQLAMPLWAKRGECSVHHCGVILKCLLLWAHASSTAVLSVA